MKRIFYILILVLALMGESFTDEILRTEFDPLVEGRGGAFAAQARSFTPSGHNPATIGESGLFFSHSSMFDGFVSVDNISYNRKVNDRMNLGAGLLYRWGDGIPITALPDAGDTVGYDNRPYIVEEKSHHDVLLRPSVSYRLRDNLTVGATAALFYRKHVDETAFGGGISAGLQAGIGSRFSTGLLIRNISTMPVSWSTGHTELALPSFRGGVAADIIAKENFNLQLAGDGEYDLNSGSIDWGVGAEGRFSGVFGLMAGYSAAGFSAGASIDWQDFGFTLSFTSQDRLDQSYRIGLTYRL